MSDEPTRASRQSISISQNLYIPTHHPIELSSKITQKETRKVLNYRLEPCTIYSMRCTPERRKQKIKSNFRMPRRSAPTTGNLNLMMITLANPTLARNKNKVKSRENQCQCLVVSRKTCDSTDGFSNTCQRYK